MLLHQFKSQNEFYYIDIGLIKYIVNNIKNCYDDIIEKINNYDINNPIHIEEEKQNNIEEEIQEQQPIIINNTNNKVVKLIFCSYCQKKYHLKNKDKHMKVHNKYKK